MEGWCPPKVTQCQGQLELKPGALCPCPHTPGDLGCPRRAPLWGAPLTPGALLPADGGTNKVRAKVGVVVPLEACFLEPVPCKDLQLPRVCQRCPELAGGWGRAWLSPLMQSTLLPPTLCQALYLGPGVQQPIRLDPCFGGAQVGGETESRMDKYTIVR